MCEREREKAAAKIKLRLKCEAGRDTGRYEDQVLHRLLKKRASQQPGSLEPGHANLCPY